ncbi:hypothetical protein WA026_007896 [Henosepilachna vigintioctopunctata]|uniref:Uncharacterized protein n=1 Tax=Henosepilachna vigintioctopunctata TaxID=420089 RepID=A0AAW1TVB1_9CUCU
MFSSGKSGFKGFPSLKSPKEIAQNSNQTTVTQTSLEDMPQFNDTQISQTLTANKKTNVANESSNEENTEDYRHSWQTIAWKRKRRMSRQVSEEITKELRTSNTFQSLMDYNKNSPDNTKNQEEADPKLSPIYNG